MRLEVFIIYAGYSHQKVEIQLIPCSRVLLEKLTVTQLVFYGTRRFITVCTTAHHLSLSWARCIPPTPSHPISLTLILILSPKVRQSWS